jgi:hypothetical protein
MRASATEGICGDGSRIGTVAGDADGRAFV